MEEGSDKGSDHFSESLFHTLKNCLWDRMIRRSEKFMSDKGSDHSPESLYSRDGILASGSDDLTWHSLSVGLMSSGNNQWPLSGIQICQLHRMIRHINSKSVGLKGWTMTSAGSLKNNGYGGKVSGVGWSDAHVKTGSDYPTPYVEKESTALNG